MALTFVQSANATDSSGSNVASIGVSLTGVGGGNLISCLAKHEGSTTTISTSDGTSTLSSGNYGSNGGSDSHGQWKYLLSANSGNKTYTSTFGASRPYPTTIIYEYSYSGTASLDGQNNSNGSSGTCSSGNFTTTGTDGVGFGAYIENTGGITITAAALNGVAADGIINVSGNFTAAWRKTYSAGFTGAATGTMSGSTTWGCIGIAFKVDAGGSVTGTFASTLGNIAAALSGTVANPGTFASTLAGIAAAFSGTVTNPGTFASILAGISAAFNGTVTNPGTFASTLGGVTAAFSGSVGGNVSGTIDSTLGGVTADFAGTVTGVNVTGTFASTLGGVTAAMSGLVDGGAGGSPLRLRTAMGYGV